MSPREITKYHINFSLPLWGGIVGVITFLGSFAALIWAICVFYTTFMSKQDKMYTAIIELSAKQDSAQSWHDAGTRRNAQMDIKVGHLDTTLHQVMEAMNIVQPATGIGLFTERRVHGHIIFEKLPLTTK